jgi:thiol-disulfide isomerase/thioredoxin
MKDRNTVPMKQLVLCLAFAVAMGGGATPGFAQPAQSKAARDGKAEHARVITEDELRQELRSHKGRPVVLHFWATWCGPCISELSTLARLARDIERRGIDFVAVSLDSPSPKSAERVSAVLTQRVRDPHWSSILRVADVDRFMNSIDPRWEGAIPAFFAFAPDAKLRGSHLGNITPGELETLLTTLIPAPNR